MRGAHRVAWFFLSGAIGFVADTAVLYALRGWLGLGWARVVSFFCAVLVTWILNRSLTFRDRQAGTGMVKEFSAYLVLMLLGGGVNYSVYIVLVLASPRVRMLPVLGVAAGSLAGMLVNLASARFLLYRHKKSGLPDRS